MVLKESLLQEVQENNKQIEKLNQVMNVNRIYAETMKDIQTSEEMEETNFRTIMLEARMRNLLKSVPRNYAHAI